MGRPSAAAVRAAVAWTPAALCAGWLLLRLSGIEFGFPLSPVMNYTPYVLPVAVLATALAAALRQWPAAALAGVTALGLFLLILPRFAGGPDEDVQGRELSVMSANVLRGGSDVERLLGLVREHDVEALALQELTPDFARRFERAGGDELFPHSLLKLRRRVSGNGLYSRYPLAQIPVEEPEPHLLFAEMEVVPGTTLEVASVHPLAPLGPGSMDAWRRGLENTPRAEPDGAIRILLGDFNAGFDNPEFRDMVDSGYEDAAEQLGQGLETTWPTKDKPAFYLPVTIDHVLFDARVGVRSFGTFELPDSDHRTIQAELIVPD